MINKAMERKLQKGEAWDVEKVGIRFRELDSVYGKVYELKDQSFLEADVDLCIASTEEWIWSVGVRYSDGRVFASTTDNFHQNSNYNCIWLR